MGLIWKISFIRCEIDLLGQIDRFLPDFFWKFGQDAFNMVGLFKQLKLDYTSQQGKKRSSNSKPILFVQTLLYTLLVSVSAGIK